MSKEVEQRVVEMRFDNKNFEKNVSETMSTLDKLKEKLNFRGVEKSFDGISSSARGVNLSPISGAVDTVMAKFSAFDAISFSVLQNLTNRAIRAGEQLVKSLSIDQISSGWKKYNDETKAVQTILNAKPELTIKDVEKELDRLSWFTDETSYSYSDMIDAIGQFTSYGVELDDAVTAMEGIANWAAASGQGINEARSAMRNLSQAMASGVIQWKDWMSVAQVAHMSTEEFKTVAIETAKSMGLLDKQGKTVKGTVVDILSFDSTLADKWFTGDVLMATLKKYGAYTDKVYDYIQDLDDASVSCADAMERVSDAGMELSSKAFKAGQESKTLTDSLEATKDAVSSIWKDIFKSIFGNYEESKKLWTNVTSDLWDIFAADISDIRDVIKDWGMNDDGREDVFAIITNSLSALKSVIDVVRNAFSKIFPPITTKTLKNAASSIKKFTEKLILTDDKADKLQRTLQGLFAILDIIRIVVTDAAQIGLTIFNTLLGKSTDKIGDITANIGDSIVSFRDWIKEHDHSVESVKKICDRIATVRKAIKDWIDDHVHLRESLSKLRDHIQNGAEKVGDFAKKLWELPAVQGAVSKTKDILKKFFTNAKEYFSEGYDKIKEFIDHLKTLDGFSFDNIKDAVKSFKEIVLDHFFNIEGGVDKLKSVFGSLKDSITGSFSKAGDSMDSFRDKISNFGKLVKEKAEAATDFSFKWAIASNNFKTYANNAKKRLKEVVDVGDLLSVALGGTLILSIKNIGDVFKTLNGTLKKFTNPLDALTDVFKGLKGVFDAYSKKIAVDAVTTMIKGVAVAIAILVGVVFVLSKLVEKGTMWDAIEGLLAIAGILLAMVAAMSAINKWLGSIKIDVGVQASILALAISIAILVKAIKMLDDVENIQNGVIAIVTLGAALTLLTAFMSKLVESDKNIMAGAVLVLAISAAMYILVAALKKLSNIQFVNVEDSIAALGAAIIGLAALTLMARGISIGGALAVIAAAIALQKLINILLKLTGGDIETIKHNLSELKTVLLLFAGIMVASKFAGANAAKVGTAILLMSVSLIIIVQVLKLLSKISDSDINKGLSVIEKVFIVFGLVTALSKFSGENAVKAGVMILLMSGSLLVIAAAIHVFGSMSTEELEKGVTVVGVLEILMGGLIAVSKLAGDAKNTLIGLSIAIAVMAVALLVLSFIEWDNLLSATIALTSVILALAAALAATKNIGKDMKVIGTIVLFAFIIAELAAALYLLADKPWESLIAAAGGLSLLLLALSTSMRIMSGMKKLGKGVTKQLIELSSIVILFGFLLTCMQVLSEGDMSTALISAASIGVLLLALAASFDLLSGMKKLKKGVTEQLYSMAGVVIILGFILTCMQVLSQGDMSTALISAASIGVLLLALAVSFDALSGMKKLNKGVIEQLYSLSGIVILLGFLLTSLQVLSEGDMSTALISAASIGVLLLALVVSFDALSGVKKLNKGVTEQLYSMAGIVIILGFVLTCMQVLSESDMSTAIVSAIAIGILLFALTVSFDALSGMKKLNKGVTGQLYSLVGVVALIGLILLGMQVLSEGDMSTAIESAIAISILLLALTVVTGVLEVLGVGGGASIKAAAAGAAALGAVILIIGGIITIIGGIFSSEKGEKLEGYLDKGIVIMGKLGKMIGLFVGNVISGFNEALSEGFKKSSESALAGAKNVAKIILLISAAEIVNGVAAFISGKNPMTKFVKDMKKLAKGLVEYSKIISEGNVDVKAVQNSADAALALAKFATSIPRSGGLAQLFAGSKDIVNFVTQITGDGTDKNPGLAAALVAYSNTVSGVKFDLDAIDNSMKAATKIVDFAKKLERSGGLLQELIGVKDLTDFVRQISYSDDNNPGLAQALIDYSNAVSKSKINVDAVEKSAKAGEALAALERALPRRDGKLQAWIGEKETLTDFALGLIGDKTHIGFADAIIGYANKLKEGGGINTDLVNDSVTAGKALAGLENNLPPMTNSKIKAFFVGEKQSLADFGSKLETFGESMAKYSQKVATIKPEAVTASANAARMLAATAEVVARNNVNNKTFDGFGQTLTTLADKITAFYTSMLGVDDDSLKNAISKVGQLVNMAKGVVGIDSKTLKSFGDSLKNMAENGVNGFISTFSNAKDRVDASAKTFLGYFVKGLEAKKGSVKGGSKEQGTVAAKFRDVVSTSLSVINAKRVDFESAGKYVVEGFAKGISDNKRIAEDAARKAAEDALLAAKDRLKEQSPSKEFYEVGHFAVLGMANALNDGGKIIYDASYGSAGNAVSGIKKAIIGISDMIESDIDTQPTIRPVLDLSDIQNGTSKMNQMLGNRNLTLSAATAGSISSDISVEMSARTPNKENELLGKISDLLEGMDSKMSDEDETTPFVMNIENFNNNTDRDIDQLTDELSVRLATKINRKKAPFR